MGEILEESQKGRMREIQGESSAGSSAGVTAGKYVCASSSLY